MYYTQYQADCWRLWRRRERARMVPLPKPLCIAIQEERELQERKDRGENVEPDMSAPSVSTGLPNAGSSEGVNPPAWGDFTGANIPV